MPNLRSQATGRRVTATATAVSRLTNKSGVQHDQEVVLVLDSPLCYR